MSKTKQWAWDTAEKVSDDIINSYVKGDRYAKSNMTYEHNGESIVTVFHGQPNPHQSDQEWVKKAWF